MCDSQICSQCRVAGEYSGIRQEQFGTQTPLYHKLHYNVRGQLFDIRLSTSSLQANEWDWNRGALINYYATADLTSPTNEARADSGPDNNGNVIRQQHWVPANDSFSSYDWADDTFTYDALNRLKSVAEAHGTPAGLGGQSYVQTYDYDRFGNRTINQGQTTGITNTQFELSPVSNQEVAEPSNRLYAAGDAGRAPANKLMRYDAAGNLTYDVYTGQGTRVYDCHQAR